MALNPILAKLVAETKIKALASSPIDEASLPDFDELIEIEPPYEDDDASYNAGRALYCQNEVDFLEAELRLAKAEVNAARISLNLVRKRQELALVEMRLELAS